MIANTCFGQDQSVMLTQTIYILTQARLTQQCLTVCICVYIYTYTYIHTYIHPYISRFELNSRPIAPGD